MATTSAATDFLEQKLIETLLKNTTYTPGANTFLAALTAAGTPESGSVTEVSTAGGTLYARQSISAAAGWSAGGQVSTAYEVSNAALISFPVAGADWGTVTHWGLYDIVTAGAGNLLVYCQLDVAKVVNNGDQLTFPIGSVKISLA